MKTITEKFIDGKLVERTTVEDNEWIARPIRTDDPMPYWDFSPWWGIIPPPRYGTGYGTSTDHTTSSR